MTAKEFVDKWKHLLSDYHPCYSSSAGCLYWCASYNEDASFIRTMTADFLSTNPPEGMSFCRAKRLDSRWKNLVESGPAPFKVGDTVTRINKTEKLVIQRIFFVRDVNPGFKPYWHLDADESGRYTQGPADQYRLAGD